MKIVAVLREPAARMNAAFWTYEHYRNRFGATAEGFNEFAAEFMERFAECAREHDWEGCAHRFEAYGARYEGVFYHADQLIKSMYATFLEGWLQMFGRGNVLVLRTEDVFSQSEKTRKEALLKAVAHLGLDEPTEDILDQMDRCRENQGDFDVVQRSLHLPGVSAPCGRGFPGSVWGGGGGEVSCVCLWFFFFSSSLKSTHSAVGSSFHRDIARALNRRHVFKVQRDTPVYVLIFNAYKPGTCTSAPTVSQISQISQIS